MNKHVKANPESQKEDSLTALVRVLVPSLREERVIAHGVAGREKAVAEFVTNS